MQSVSELLKAILRGKLEKGVVLWSWKFGGKGRQKRKRRTNKKT